MAGPLAGLQVLDFSTLLPGPYASMILADLGADVLRVEAPDRPDVLQQYPETASWHAVLNRSKRSIALDLKCAGAADVVKRLVATHDIVLEQFRPGVMDRLGVGFEALQAVNSRLIYCALTGYGQTGPYRDRAGHDINYLSLAGVMSHTGRRDTGPVPVGVQIADIGGGSLGSVTGILAAVIERERSGQGQFVDISMLDTSVAWNAMNAAHVLAGGPDAGYETGLLNGGSYYDFYRTRDGRYLSVGSLEPKFWVAFCKALERPDLIDAPGKPGTEAARSVNAEIQNVIGERDLETWMSVFAGTDACVEPVLNASEMLEHPQVKARGMVVDVPTADGQIARQVGSPYAFSRSRARYTHTGSTQGEHSETVLLEAGYSADEIDALHASGILG